MSDETRFIVSRTNRETKKVEYFVGNDDTKKSVWSTNADKAASLSENQRALKMRGLTAAFDREYRYADEIDKR
jgi:hypothetical protein